MNTHIKKSKPQSGKKCVDFNINTFVVAGARLILDTVRHHIAVMSFLLKRSCHGPYAVGVRPSKDRTSRVWSRHEKNKKALEMLQHLI